MKPEINFIVSRMLSLFLIFNYSALIFAQFKVDDYPIYRGNDLGVSYTPSETKLLLKWV